MKINYFQRGFNFSQDGPGNRLVYHFQGCNLICPWCANPEGIAKDGTLMTGDRVNGTYCEKGAVNGGKIDRTICKACDKPCVKIPASGIKLSCVSEETESIADYAKSCEPMFFDGGGVTVTGGEPTVQFDALTELFMLLKEKGINTALETNGTHPKLPGLFPLIDYLITDCKHYDSEKHRGICGAGNETILKNIELACEERNRLLVRIPLIGGFNSSADDAVRFAETFEKITNDKCCFEFLMYHEFGKNKYERCGMTYTMTDEAKVGIEEVKLFTETFNAHSLKTVRT
ncbi:MAG: radical SAM protein [Clostridia bacterium]|nr:radical SAM protein [Clostridia bacterium]